MNPTSTTYFFETGGHNTQKLYFGHLRKNVNEVRTTQSFPRTSAITVDLLAYSQAFTFIGPHNRGKCVNYQDFSQINVHFVCQ